MKDKIRDADELREKVREGYAAVALEGEGCCGGAQSRGAKEFSKGIGYSEQELAELPDGANLGAGCGNPTHLASGPGTAARLPTPAAMAVDELDPRRRRRAA